jgi:hypothetical protein
MEAPALYVDDVRRFFRRLQDPAQPPSRGRGSPYSCVMKRRRLVRLKRGSQAGTRWQASAAGSMPDAVASGKSPERANSSGSGQRRGPGTLAECLTHSSSTRSRSRTATAADWR